VIVRIVEYGVRCDSPDCDDPSTNVWGATTRNQCIAEAEKHGYVRCSRGRWLCKRCADRLLPKQTK
jgi:hypothetical protein